MGNALLNLINFNCLFEIAQRKSNNAEESFGFRVCTHFARRKSKNASLNLCLAPLSSYARSCRTREFCVHRVVLVKRKIPMKMLGGCGGGELLFRVNISFRYLQPHTDEGLSSSLLLDRESLGMRWFIF